MKGAESTADDDSWILLSKRQVTMKKITLASFFLLKLFSFHSHCVQNAYLFFPYFIKLLKKHVKRLRAALYSKIATLHGPHNFWTWAAVCTPLAYDILEKRKKSSSRPKVNRREWKVYMRYITVWNIFVVSFECDFFHAILLGQFLDPKSNVTWPIASKFSTSTHRFSETAVTFWLKIFLTTSTVPKMEPVRISRPDR